MLPNVPECARMCLCYGLECAAGLGLPVNAFCVSHVWAGVTLNDPHANGFGHAPPHASCYVSETSGCFLVFFMLKEKTLPNL